VRKRILATALVSLHAASCGHQDARVGWDPPAEGSLDVVTGPTLSTEFTSDEGLWDQQIIDGGAAIAFGRPSSGAADDAVVELTFPGHPGWATDQNAGPAFATQIATQQSLGYGRYRTRMQPARCDPSEEVVSSVFVFFNDGTDKNANGLTDNSEIDMQFLCGTPSIISLSTWTDYQVSGGTEEFIKLTHEVDTTTGDYYDTSSDRSDALRKTGTSAELALPGFPQAGVFYDMGFDWRPSALRFFIVYDGREITLWNLTADSRVPPPAARLMYNIWHPPEHWFPVDGAPAPAYPAADAIMRVDRFEYWAD
jgi:hypothetical protein